MTLVPVDTTYLNNNLIGLRRCNERLVIRVGVHDVTLTPEQEAEFWKQVREVIDEKTAMELFGEASYKASLQRTHSTK